MGMDVYGISPKNEKGRYFRNNVWWWRPLWDYCCDVGKDVISKDIADGGHMNDGWGLDEEGAKKLAKILRTEIREKRTKEYAFQRIKRISALPMEKCEICHGTGKRNGATCNSCGGAGKTAAFERSYPFTVQNVVEFVRFLENCGGFEIC